MEPKTLYFDKKLIVQTFFHADIKPITINKVDVKRIVLSKKILLKIKVHLSTLLGMMILKLALYHYT